MPTSEGTHKFRSYSRSIRSNLYSGWIRRRSLAWPALNRILGEARREREILEHSTPAVPEQAANADDLVDT